MDSRLSYIRLLLLRVWLLQAACEFSSLVPPFFPFPLRAALFYTRDILNLLLMIDTLLNPKSVFNQTIAGGMAGGSVQGLQWGEQWFPSPKRDT